MPATSNCIGRRDLFSAGTAATLGLLMAQEASAGVQNPAENVADRTSTLKITAVRGFSVAGKIYVRIETNHGIIGWGETYGMPADIAISLAESLIDLLEGENPTRIEHLWQNMYRSQRDLRGGPFMTGVISAIDTALWDITGKAWGVPLHRLLGGPTRDKIRLYPSSNSYKIGPGGPKNFAGSPQMVQGYVDHIAAIRKRVGPDGAIILDTHCAFPPPLLIQLAGAIEPYSIWFIEEPAVPGNIEVFKRLKEQIRIPLATGERDRTIWEFIPYLQERCIDILQPDIGACGGVSQMKKIATLGETYFVPLAPHNATTVLGMTASLHVMASIPMFLIHEGGQGYNPGDVVRKSWTIDDQGYASLPDGPGIGVEIDEVKLEKMHAERNRKIGWPKPKLEDGSIADY